MNCSSAWFYLNFSFPKFEWCFPNICDIHCPYIFLMFYLTFNTLKQSCILKGNWCVFSCYEIHSGSLTGMKTLSMTQQKPKAGHWFSCGLENVYSLGDAPLWWTPQSSPLCLLHTPQGHRWDKMSFLYKYIWPSCYTPKGSN